MEKTSTNSTTVKNEFLSLENRNKIHLTGIKEVISSSDTNLTIKLYDTTINITGSDISILKLDIDTGSLDADGKFEKIIYGKEGNIFKRLFK